MRKNNKKKFQKFSFLFLLFLVSCSSLRREDPDLENPVESQQQDPSEPVESSGEVLEPSEHEIIEPHQEAPEPIKENLYKKFPKNIRVFLPHTQVHGFAGAGALQALEKNKIKIQEISGIGLGAVFGALFAVSKSANDFEWKIMQVAEDLILYEDEMSSSGFFSEIGGSPEEAALKKVFQGLGFGDARIPLAIGVWDDSKSNFQWVSQGDLVEVLAASLKTALQRKKGIVRKLYPIGSLLLRRSGSLLVVESVQEKKYVYQQALLRSQKDLTLADYRVRPNLMNVQNSSLKDRSEAIYAGRRATEKLIQE